MRYILIVLLIVGCSTPEQQLTQIQKDLKNIREKYSQEQSRLHNLIAQQSDVQNNLAVMRAEIVSLGHLKLEGEGKVFILKLKSKKESLSLDIFKHMADDMNAVEFEIPVPAWYYDAHKIGDKLGSNFTFMSKTWGDVVITVQDKEIRNRQ